MVTKYSMSELLGNVSIDYEDQGRSLSPETRAAVETEVCSCRAGHGCMHCHLQKAVHASRPSLDLCMRRHSRCRVWPALHDMRHDRDIVTVYRDCIIRPNPAKKPTCGLVHGCVPCAAYVPQRQLRAHLQAQTLHCSSCTAASHAAMALLSVCCALQTRQHLTFH